MEGYERIAPPRVSAPTQAAMIAAEGDAAPE